MEINFNALSPMMKQYFEIKEQYSDCLLFFRLGDFYEMFFDDAKTASAALDITLTGRDCGQQERAPMCGVPFHSADQYVDRLIEQGFKVAICEQMEDPAVAKGIVKREVVRVITAGTVTSEHLLEDKKNNYLCSIYIDKNGCGMTFADITTGELAATEFSGTDLSTEIMNELSRNLPSEILMNENPLQAELTKIIKERLNVNVQLKNDMFDTQQIANQKILEQFGENPVTSSSHLTISIAVVLEYLLQTQKRSLPHIREVKIYYTNQFMNIDFSTRRNLELTETMRERRKRGSLLWVLDKTMTAMGGRCLRSWIDKPLLSCGQIKHRQSGVEKFVKDPVLRGEIREILSPIQDLERLVSKIVTGAALPRDMIALSRSINGIGDIKHALLSLQCEMLCEIGERLDPLEDVAGLIYRAIVEEPPFSVREGGIIRDGFDEDVDKFRKAMNEGTSWLAGLEAQEREKTGIKNLKIGYNRVFGYYIEVSKSNMNNVPDRYVRKQTLANCERYITGELKEIENTVIGAQERNNQLEYDLFCQLRERIAKENERILNTAHLIAQTDVLSSLAEVAAQNGYVLPTVLTNDVISINDGRHPVIEQMRNEVLFVPNDTYLSNKERLSIITGPNMAGKSTYMRQVALIVLMAQIGSFVPAASAQIGIVDKIFTRVGASDDLASGQSTFMVEMTEVANILKNATPKSLLILDEIGRGTSTYDGLSIAWAVIEYIANKKKLGAKTLFATHYHELTELEGKVDGVKNYCIAVKKRGEEIIFLRKIILGGADDSYGIEVAKLAGVNGEVIKRAKEIVSSLEQSDINQGRVVPMKQYIEPADEMLPLFEINYKEIIDEIKVTDITTITPIEALNMLYELKKKAEKL